MKDRIKSFALLASAVAGAFIIAEFIRLLMWALAAAGFAM